MQLGIYSSRRVCYEGEAVSLNCKAAAGELTILDHHRPLVTVLEAGPVKVRPQSGEERVIEARSGFLEVRPGSVVNVLIEE